MNLVTRLTEVGIKPINYFEQINSVNGHGTHNGGDIYYKFSPRDRGIQERDNTELFSKFYPTPKPLSFFEIDDDTVLLLYEYHPELEQLENIMAGWIRKVSPMEVLKDQFWLDFTDHIKTAYEKTMTVTSLDPTECPGELINKVRGQNGKKMDMVFGGKDWPALDYLFDIKSAIVDGVEVMIDIGEIKRGLRDFCYSRKPTIYAVTHGNLSELNIATQPLFFDTSAAGVNPILIDTFSFLWHTENACGYLIPKYVPAKVPRFPELLKDTYDFNPEWKWSKDRRTIEISFRNKLPIVRQNIVDDWMQNIVVPLAEEGTRMLSGWDWNYDLFNYCMLRTIKAQRLVSAMDSPDKIFFIGQIARLLHWHNERKTNSPLSKND